MIDLKITDDMIAHSKMLIKKNNYAQRGLHDGNKRKQFIGVLAENIVRKFLKKDFLKC